MINKDRFLEKALKYDIDASKIIDALDLYADILVSYNKKVNLTAITQPEEIEDKHFIDSLLLAKMPQINGSVVDVGTGAGFPGVVAKLYKPQIELTLLEPTGKRITFLQHVCAELGIVEGVHFVKERAEEAARKNYREQYDVATARAVASMGVLCEYCLPLVKKGGHFIAMKGSSGVEEMGLAKGAVKKLGGEFISSELYLLPQGDARTLIVAKKISQTATAYPRGGAKIAKEPLK